MGEEPDIKTLQTAEPKGAGTRSRSGRGSVWALILTSSLAGPLAGCGGEPLYPSMDGEAGPPATTAPSRRNGAPAETTTATETETSVLSAAKTVEAGGTEAGTSGGGATRAPAARDAATRPAPAERGSRRETAFDRALAQSVAQFRSQRHTLMRARDVMVPETPDPVRQRPASNVPSDPLVPIIGEPLSPRRFNRPGEAPLPGTECGLKSWAVIHDPTTTPAPFYDDRDRFVSCPFYTVPFTPEPSRRESLGGAAALAPTRPDAGTETETDQTDDSPSQ